MTVLLPIYRDSLCAISVTPWGNRSARFRLTYLLNTPGSEGQVDPERRSADIDVRGDDLDDLQLTMKSQGWVIEKTPKPARGGVRLIVRPSSEPLNWSRKGCPLSVTSTTGTLRVTLAVPGLPTTDVSWSIQGASMTNFFEQMLLGPYDGRGETGDTTPVM